MGGEPWFYFVPYQADVNSALQALRQREFRAGRYNPVMPMPEFPVDADADGTRSILDMERVSDDPDYGSITAVSDEDLVDLFGTSRPTREMIESTDDLFEALERGQGVYIVAYRDDKPSEIFFAGYSFDCLTHRMRP